MCLNIYWHCTDNLTKTERILNLLWYNSYGSVILKKIYPSTTVYALYVTVFLISITSIVTFGVTKGKKSGKIIKNLTRMEGISLYSANNNIGTKKECFHAKVASIRNNLVSEFQRE